jgi:hypothetical protein
LKSERALLLVVFEQVTLLVWPAPKDVGSDDEAGRITSYFSAASASDSSSAASSSIRAAQASTAAASHAAQQERDELALALKLSLEEEQTRRTEQGAEAAYGP